MKKMFYIITEYISRLVQDGDLERFRELIEDLDENSEEYAQRLKGDLRYPKLFLYVVEPEIEENEEDYDMEENIQWLKDSIVEIDGKIDSI